MTRITQKGSLLLLCLILALCSGSAQGQRGLPETKEEWIARLTKITEPQGEEHWILNRFVTLDPELSYSILQECWSKLLTVRVKTGILSRFAFADTLYVPMHDGKPFSMSRVQAHLLDILDLAARDKSVEVRTSAWNYLFPYALQSFNNVQEYTEWCKKNEGRRVDEVIRIGYTEFAKKLHDIEPARRMERLALLARLRLVTDFTVAVGRDGSLQPTARAIGLTGLRRQMIFDTGILDTLADWLKPGSQSNVTLLVLTFLADFYPPPSYLQKIEQDAQRELTAHLTANLSDGPLRLVALYHSRWALELQSRIVLREYPANRLLMLTTALSQSNDPIVIPTLIAALEVADDYEAGYMQRALRRLAHLPDGADQDYAWWRFWWKQNRQSLPSEVRTRPLPSLQRIPGERTFAVRRNIYQIDLHNDPKRHICLITPGILLKRVTPSATKAKGNDEWADIPKSERPGLLVVLSNPTNSTALNQDTSMWSEQEKARWRKITDNLPGKRYMVALLVPPRWSQTQNILWPLRRDQSLLKAEFTTEEFVQDSVRSLSDFYPINPERIYLHGIGAGGLAAAACSLELSTPIKGFSLRSANFRSGMLPSLVKARNRRYALSVRTGEKVYPAFLTDSAARQLQKAGAQVQKISVVPVGIPVVEKPPGKELPGVGGLQPETEIDREDREALIQAVRWLEAQARQ